MTLTRPRHVLGILLLGAPALTFAAQQLPGSPPPAVDRPAVVVGRVFQSSGGPVAGAIVTLQGASSPLAERVMTDAQGRFVFGELPAGRYTLRATKAGWVEGAYGRVRPEGPLQELALAEGARALDVAIAMWRTGTISGTVMDEAGEPLVLTPVRALVRSRGWREPRWTTVSTVLTDDRGRFVVTGLIPADYVVAVPSTVVSTPAGAPMRGTFDPANVTVFNTPLMFMYDPVRILEFGALGPNDRSFVVGDQFLTTMTPAAPGVGNDGPRIYATTFYPESPTAAGSAPIALKAGEERTGVDLQLRPARTTRISGRVVTGSRENLDRVILVLNEMLGDADLAPATDIPVAVTISDDVGQFSFPVTVEGRYVITAQRTSRPRSGETPKWGFLAIDAGASRSDIVVSVREGLSVAGQLEFPTGERPSADDLRSVRVRLEPVVASRASTSDSTYPSPLSAFVAPDRSFLLSGVRPFDYYIRVDTLDANRWNVRTVRLADRDVTDAVVHVTDDVDNVLVTFGGRSSRLSGRVNGEPGVAVAVIVFPADGPPVPELAGNSRRLRFARVDDAGAFDVSDLPGGEYFVTAVPDEQAGAWDTEGFLRSLVFTATRVQLREGDDKIITLTTTRISR
jgi:hypothetical protein